MEPFVTAFVHQHKNLVTGTPAWLVDARNRHLLNFKDKGLPTRKDEDWKYLNLKALAQASFAIPGDIKKKSPSLDSIKKLSGNMLVFINGGFDEQQSVIKTQAGVTMGSLREELRKNSDSLKNYFSDKPCNNPFYNLNRAFTHDGAFIEVGAGVAANETIHLVFVSQAAPQALAVQPHNLILLQAGSKATIVEHFVGENTATTLTNTLTHIALKERAILNHYKIQNEDLLTFHMGYMDVQQDQESEFIATSIALGNKVSRQQIQVAIKGKAAKCILNGLFVGNRDQQIDHHVKIDHYEPFGTSQVLFKGILDDQSRGVFNGKIVVHPQAQKTDSQMTSKNLLLSREAEVDPKPELEIYADDVKCAHGATVGQLDETSLFYLQSRGLTRKAAEHMLIHGFARDLILQIKCEPVREYVEALLAQKLKF